MAESGAETVLRVVDALADGSAVATEQSGPVTLAPKPTADDAHVTFDEPAPAVHARVRGVTPEPGAFAHLGQTRVKLLRSALLPGGTTSSAPHLAPGAHSHWSTVGCSSGRPTCRSCSPRCNRQARRRWTVRPGHAVSARSRAWCSHEPDEPAAPAVASRPPTPADQCPSGRVRRAPRGAGRRRLRQPAPAHAHPSRRPLRPRRRLRHRADLRVDPDARPLRRDRRGRIRSPARQHRVRRARRDAPRGAPAARHAHTHARGRLGDRGARPRGRRPPGHRLRERRAAEGRRQDRRRVGRPGHRGAERRRAAGHPLVAPVVGGRCAPGRAGGGAVARRARRPARSRQRRAARAARRAPGARHRRGRPHRDGRRRRRRGRAARTRHRDPGR